MKPFYMLIHTLPWSHDALEPYISSEIMSFHFDKHHQGYVSKYNQIHATNHDLGGKELEDVLSMLTNEIAHDDLGRLKLFENGAQAWNHDFLWKSMKLNTDPNHLMNHIEQAFGDLDNMRKAFVEAGLGQFGSGWVWIVKVGQSIDICTTGNADGPLYYSKNIPNTKMNDVPATGLQPLAVCDVWEHAYYLQYKNNRQSYLEQFFNYLLNWDFVLENLNK